MSPRSGSEKRQRTTIVTMRISPQEAATIRQLAQNRGETVSAMMRSALLHNRPRLTRIDLQAVARLLGQLMAKIGSEHSTRSLTISTPAVPATASRAGWATRCAICQILRLVCACGRSAKNHGGRNTRVMRTDAPTFEAIDGPLAVRYCPPCRQ